MSSFRKALPRREHKERSQPSDRSKFGLLEKHKDYVVRAKDYQQKHQSLQRLREKAAFRNPDEFYHKMINTKVVDKVHRPESQAKQYTHEELLLMKTQDIRYVLNKAQSEQRKVERLRSVLHGLDEQSCNQHVRFAEDREEAAEIKAIVLQKDAEAVAPKPLPKRLLKERKAAYRELEERKERANKLKNIVSEMSIQKQLMGKGRKRKLRPEELSEPTEAPVYKWRKERKK